MCNHILICQLKRLMESKSGINEKIVMSENKNSFFKINYIMLVTFSIYWGLVCTRHPLAFIMDSHT